MVEGEEAQSSQHCIQMGHHRLVVEEGQNWMDSLTAMQRRRRSIIMFIIMKGPNTNQFTVYQFLVVIRGTSVKMNKPNQVFIV
jgi:hypothetical protein